ncbi:hypothetical protein EFQ99_32460 [Rhizobium vallis]|uniref:Uncharacterized protein n=1 Tax=Rhizobium vallis TaxID=634290 RepID=A0A432PAU6_9HYPH|nr:hypothetical protein [Rhizobium vallis]RUM18830.1 hypothetical protein EFQ99_32460 [Rhizobium vallis]
MEDREILAGLVASTMPLMADERYGRLKIRERPIMHRIAVNLEHYFPDWEVDTDYNRHGEEVKRLQRPGGGTKNIEPDILVHIKGEPLANLLAVELKLSDNNDIEDDIFKLKGLTHTEQGFVYRVGVLLQLHFARKAVVICNVFKAGERNEELTGWLREAFEKAIADLKKAPEGAA